MRSYPWSKTTRVICLKFAKRWKKINAILTDNNIDNKNDNRIDCIIDDKDDNDNKNNNNNNCKDINKAVNNSGSK